METDYLAKLLKELERRIARLEQRLGQAITSAESYENHESLEGEIDGSNKVFYLKRLPRSDEKVNIYYNGLLQQSTDDYVLDLKTGKVTLSDSNPAPELGTTANGNVTDVLTAGYQKSLKH